jgi:hypothetical protein
LTCDSRDGHQARPGVGYVGGEVNDNHMDATLVVHTASWVMAELVRIFHDTDVATATATVQALFDRQLALIWEVNGVKLARSRRGAVARGGDAPRLVLVRAGTHGQVPMASLEQDWLSNYK